MLDVAAFDLAAFNDASLDAGDIIDLVLERFPGETVLSCSFGGPTGMVALDMVLERDRTVPVYYLDTELLFPQTYDLVDRVAERYGVRPIPVRAPLGVLQQNAQYGNALWERDPDACCNIRKVEPQQAFLKNRSAWITGLRRDQSIERSRTERAVWDPRFEVIRVSPFAYWNEERTWSYVRERGLPYNELNDQGYPSVGCVPCTRAVAIGEDRRAGRWAGSQKTECGLHLQGTTT